ncbi:MAG: hypothetical protein Q9167_003588 [Letrouitia subvulpina]
MVIATEPFPPSNRIVPGSFRLPTAPFPNHVAKSGQLTSASLNSIASEWVAAFKNILAGDHGLVTKIFAKEAYWRDLLCMFWDFHTVHGHDQILTYVEKADAKDRIQDIGLFESPAYKLPQLVKFHNLHVIQAFLRVETRSGRGVGLVRLVPGSDDGDLWRAFTLFTTLEELKGHEENIHDRRPSGLDYGSNNATLNWKDQLLAQKSMEHGHEPAVLILGAGQGGLTMAARLKQLSVDTLVIDQNRRVGDNWRKRYRQLKFTPKDKLADWFEYYVGILELNVWTSTALDASEWNDETRRWTVTVKQDIGGSPKFRKFHPRHIILATGHAGEPYLPSNIDPHVFKGDSLLHSTQFTEPKPDGRGKRVVVVGSSNSSHDVARDYANHGYDVIMVQRSSTLVLTSQTLIDVTMKGLYAEDGPPVDDADIINMSVPNPVAKTCQIAATKDMMHRDRDLLSGLLAAGFAVDSGVDSSGLFIKYLSRGGGYYIDVGASQLIVEGKIRVKQGFGVKSVKEHSLVLDDDSELEADEVVFATGFQNMRDTARKLLGNDLASQVHG